MIYQLRSVVVLAVLSAPLVLSACNSSIGGSAEPEPSLPQPASTISAVHTVGQASITPYPTIPAPEAENVPLYPDVRNVSYDKVYARDWRRISFHTDATLDEISSFYKEQLAEHGWMLINETQEGSTKWVNFRWSGSEQSLPWDVTLDIHMWHITATSDQLVDLNLERVPILDRIPLYLDAHSVEKKQLPSETTQFTDLHTWYTTRAAPEEVEAYYLGELPQHGWTGPEPGSNITTKGVIFGWGTGTFHRLTFYKLSIAASRTSTAETIVHLKIEGTISR